MRILAFSLLAAPLLLANGGGCHGTTPPPATEVRTQTVVRETMRPCDAAHPARPARLPDPLPTGDLYALSVMLALKVDEYAGPGKWADQMDSSLTTCTKP